MSQQLIDPNKRYGVGLTVMVINQAIWLMKETVYYTQNSGHLLG